MKGRKTGGRKTQFWDHFEKTDGCWLWTGATKNGYGVLKTDGETEAHRYSWKVHRGPIPEGLTIDHLCRVTLCVNPDHLEPVTMRENLMRGNGFGALNARKTHCPSGHPYDDANTYRHRPNHRTCRTCGRERARAKKLALASRSTD